MFIFDLIVCALLICSVLDRKCEAVRNSQDKSDRFDYSSQSDEIGQVFENCSSTISAPLNLKASERSNSSITLAWNPPKTTAVEIDGYILQWEHTGDNQLNLTAEELNCTVTLLEVFTNYTFTLFAYNLPADKTVACKGTSAVLNTRTSPGSPTEPLNLLAKVVGPDKVDLSWKEPATKNGNLDGFLISWKKSGSASETSNGIRGILRSYTVGKLEPYTSYSFYARAWNNDHGQQLFSNSANASATTLVGEPGIVRDVELSCPESSLFSLKWMRPEVLNGPLDGYVISVTTPSEAERGENVTGIVQSLTFSHLTAFTNYSIKIWAFNLDDSPSSAGKRLLGPVTEISTTTQVGAPSDCRTIFVEEVTFHSILIKWEEPEVKNGPISGYLLKWQTENVTETAEYEVFGSQRNFNISGLLPNQSYVISVEAFNIVQDVDCVPGNNKTLYGKPMSIVVGTEESEPVPGEVTYLRFVCAEATSLFASWSEPIEPIGPLQGYEISLTSDSDATERNYDHQGEYLNWTFIDLMPYTNYTMTISAYYLSNSPFSKGERIIGFPQHISTNTQASAPTVCLNVTINEVTANAISFTWKEPLYKNGPVSGYFVEWQRETTDSKDGTELNVNDNSFNITGLLAYSSYSVNLKAYNLVENYNCTPGRNETLSGEPVLFKALTKVSAPGPVNNVTVLGRDFTSLTVKWNKPTELNGPLTGYCLSISNQKEDCILANYRDSYTFMGLKIFTQYNISIQAYNTDKSSSKNENQLRGPPTIINATTSAGKPDEVQSVEFQCPKGRVLTVNWTKPANPNGPVDGYQLSFRNDTNETDWHYEALGNATFWTFTDLTPLTSYTLEIRAFNYRASSTTERLFGPPREVGTTTGAAAPSVCQNVYTKAVNTRSMLIEWKEPADRNGDLNGYIVQWRCQCDSKTQQSEVDTTNLTISDLLPNQKYTIMVQAFNFVENYDCTGKNETLYSNPATEIVESPDGKPGKAENVQFACPSATSLSSTWAKPQKPNGTVDGYEIVLTSDVEKERRIKVDGETDAWIFGYLIPYARYTLNISAFIVYNSSSSEGEQLSGPPVEISATTQAGEPGKCQSLLADNPTSDTIQVNWKEPTNAYGPLSGYLLEWNCQSGCERGQMELSETSFNISSLHPSSNYSITIKAFNIIDNYNCIPGKSEKLYGEPVSSSAYTKDIPQDGKTPISAAVIAISVVVPIVVVVLFVLAVISYQRKIWLFRNRGRGNNLALRLVFNSDEPDPDIH